MCLLVLMVLPLLGALVCLLVLMVPPQSSTGVFTGLNGSSPEQHYAPSTSEPLSSGLRTLSEMLSWGRSSASPLDVATVPLAARDPPLATSGHRTLVSHDMMGGYLDDRWELAAL